jgi:WD40 repeat protein
VRLVDAATGQIVRDLSLTAGFVLGPKGDLRGSPDGVRSLAFSADGKQLFVGMRSSSVVRFDLDKPENTPAKQWKASKIAVEQLAVSPDGKTVYGLCRPEIPVFVWNADTGALITKLEPGEKENLNAFTVLPSGDVIAGNDHRLYHWDTAHKLVNSYERRIGLQLTATNNSMLLAASAGSLDIYDRDGFQIIERYFDPKVRTAAHDESVRSIVLHPSGAYIATAAGDRERTVKVWELSSGRLIGTVTSPGTTPIRLAWSGDGRYLLATSAAFVSRWRFTPAEAQQFACVNGNVVASATFLPDGSVVSLGEVRKGKRELNHELGSKRLGSNWWLDPGGNGRVGISGGLGGTLVATLDTPGVLHWRPGTPFPPLQFTKQPTRCARISPDGKTLWAVVSSQDVHSFDLATQEPREKWSNASEEVFSGLANLDALAVSRTAVVVGCENGSVYVLDPATCKPVVIFTHSNDPVLSVAIADDSLVVAGTQSGLLRVMNLATKTELPSVAAHSNGTTAVAISRDGSLLVTGGQDRSVRVWKRVCDHFEPLFTISDLPGAVRELQFGQNDNRLLVLVSHGHAARVWDMDKLRAQLTERKLGW